MVQHSHVRRESERKQQLWNSGHVLSVERSSFQFPSLPMDMWIMYEPGLSSDGKATSQKQQHARECCRLLPLTAVLGHFRCEPPLPACASEMLLKSLKLKSSKWVQKGILKSTSTIEVAYVRTVFILAHGVLKRYLQSKRTTIDTAFDWSS